jgi:hypothetical protein
MKRSCCRISVSLFFILGALFVGCGGGGDSGEEGLPVGVAARLGGESIRESAVNRRMNATYELHDGSVKSFGPPHYRSCIAGLGPQDSHPAKQAIRQCKVRFDIARAQAVDSLLEAEWLTREAKRRGLDTDSQVKLALRRTERIASLTGSDTPFEDSDPAFQARVAAQYRRLLETMHVTEQEIIDYAGANSDVYLDSETRVAQVVHTTTKQKALQARKELKTGESWMHVRNRYDVNPSPVPLTVEEANRPEDAFGRALFLSKSGQLIGPIRTLSGWYIFEITKVRPPRHRGLTRQAHATVASTIRSHKLAGVLNRRYGPQTTCATRYQVPEAPRCQ